jgi:uncharacterized surface protein with fasciclin (FAS1) repeats
MSTILQIANADRNLHLLIKGLKASRLEEKLDGNGPFTLLAPVNLAFRNIAYPDSFENLLVSDNLTKLWEILAFHVLTIKRMMKDFVDGQRIKTFQGKEVTARVSEGRVHINGARILYQGMQGSNGVVLLVDSVNIPNV